MKEILMLTDYSLVYFLLPLLFSSAFSFKYIFTHPCWPQSFHPHLLELPPFG
jgi:hypothetical protein